MDAKQHGQIASINFHKQKWYFIHILIIITIIIIYFIIFIFLTM
jgi:hypothetical protein